MLAMRAILLNFLLKLSAPANHGAATWIPRRAPHGSRQDHVAREWGGKAQRPQDRTSE
jgi:hypothetical protein